MQLGMPTTYKHQWLQESVKLRINDVGCQTGWTEMDYRRLWYAQRLLKFNNISEGYAHIILVPGQWLLLKDAYASTTRVWMN